MLSELVVLNDSRTVTASLSIGLFWAFILAHDCMWDPCRHDMSVFAVIHIA